MKTKSQEPKLPSKAMSRWMYFFGALSIIPLFASSCINMIVGMQYWLGADERMQFYFGQLNNEFIASVNAAGLLSFCIMATMFLRYGRHNKQMHRLDVAIIRYEDARRDMEGVRDEYTRLIQVKKSQ